MQMKTKLILSLIISVTINAFLQAQTYGSFADTRDGNTYRTVKIGHQTWMAENLNYDTSSGSWCYDDDVTNCTKYGRLYNWETAKDVCPLDWHLPSKNDFVTLISNVGGRGSNAYHALIEGGSSGFDAFLGGWRENNEDFKGIVNFGLWWSSSELNCNLAYDMNLINDTKFAIVLYNGPKEWGFSVRCLKE